MAPTQIYISSHGITVGQDQELNEFYVTHGNVTIVLPTITTAMEIADCGVIASLPFECVDATPYNNGDIVEMWQAAANGTIWVVSLNTRTGIAGAYAEDIEDGGIKWLLANNEDRTFDDCAEFLTGVVLRGVTYSDIVIG